MIKRRLSRGEDISPNWRNIPSERERIENQLRNRILNQIKSQGFFVDENYSIIKPDLGNKEVIRNFHMSACADKYNANRRFLAEKEDELLNYFADGTEIEIDSFKPKLQVVESGTMESDLFRYATLLWSVPVSRGFGRRVRFLLWDQSNGKLIGLFALGDPVFNLKCRDMWIGWDHRARAERLYNVMDIFILGSVPPYNTLLGGKLIAMVATSDEVREIIKNRYQNKKTIIQNKLKNPQLALLTTASALGRSSLYDRIKYDGRWVYERIGESEGWGHFHLNHGLFDDMLDYLMITKPNVASSNRFGQGPNWKIRTARECLGLLGLPNSLLKHGIQREIYGIPLAKNFSEFLRGDTSKLIYYEMPFNKITTYWYERWFVERSKRKPEYNEHKRKDVSQMIHKMGSILEN